MLNKSKMLRFLSLSLAVAGFVLVSGYFTETNAQVRDPFETPSWKRPKTKTGTLVNGKLVNGKKLPPQIMPVMAPAIEQRIAYYKQLRESAASNGMQIPKVTSVLTLEEMAVTGIFRTPRGWAAMIEATPIKLSYTIYPGEKFFDGQLVAIEENRLTFRKVVKMSNGKFISSVENKTLRQYTVQEQIQGTAPIESNSANRTEVVTNGSSSTPTAAAQTDNKANQTVAPTQIVSPVDEMNNQPAEKPQDSVKDKNGKKNKKPVKVAKKS